MKRSLAVLLLLVAATAARADVVRILNDNRAAAQARVDMIQQAKTQIDAMYFLAQNDQITFAALQLLREARLRGVAVRLIVDDNFDRVPRTALACLLDAGVQIRVYHPFNIRHPSWLWRRMHDKVIVVDGRRYITGGRNLAASYFGLSKKRNYIDRDVYVDGASASEALGHFENLWSGGDVADLRPRVKASGVQHASMELEQALAHFESDGFLRSNTGDDWSAGQRDIPDVQFLHDSGGESVAPHLFALLSGAKSSIVIETPYLIPTQAVRNILQDRREHNVKISILTNSARSTDSFLAYVGYLRHRRWLLRQGITVREFKGPDILHGKSVVIDGHIALIGSYNFDPRSQNLNTEVMCVVDDERTAHELLAAIDRNRRNSWDARDRAVSVSASFRMWFMRLMAPVIEPQL